MSGHGMKKRSHQPFEIRPGKESAFAGDVGPLVQRRVDHPEAHVAHPDFVGIGERQAPLHRRLVQPFMHGVQLAARVARGFLRGEDEPVEDGELHAARV